MNDNINVRGEHIQQVYEWYCEDELIVNRKYQRKLVWLLEEKRAFIDSILGDFPVPLFLLAFYKEGEGEVSHRRYEIIDGMQRLEAIISFIQGKFSVVYEGKHCFFDLETLPRTLEQLREGAVTQREPKLPYKACRAFANYMLPLTITEQDDEKVEETFRRINSTGRKLSAQDLRQAGVVDEFTSLVQTIAAQIRGDITDSELLNMDDMRKISLSSNGLNYGIDVRKTFWVKQGIITEYNIRLSKDEELIAYILSHILLGNSVSTTARGLDGIYTPDSERHVEIVQRIKQLGSAEITNNFMRVMNEIKSIFRACNSTFEMHCFSDIKVRGKRKVFQVIFTALYELQQESYYIEDYKKVAEKLRNIMDVQFAVIKEDNWNFKIRNDLVLSAKALLRENMRKTVKDVVKQQELTVRLEKILNTSRVEQQMYDFKECLVKEGEKKFNRACLEKIGKTLAAMANTKVSVIGYVIIGIADTAESAKCYDKLYGVKSSVFAERYINGIGEEAKNIYGSLDKYLQKFCEAINKLPFNTVLKSYILQNFEVIHYIDKDLIILQAKMLDEPAIYNGKYYVREGSSTVEVKPGTPELNDLMQRVFRNAKGLLDDSVSKQDACV